MRLFLAIRTGADVIAPATGAADKEHESQWNDRSRAARRLGRFTLGARDRPFDTPFEQVHNLHATLAGFRIVDSQATGEQ
jgi:hypothetical protein